MESYDNSPYKRQTPLKASPPKEIELGETPPKKGF